MRITVSCLLLLSAGGCGIAAKACGLEALNELEQAEKAIQNDRDGMEAKYLALAPDKDEALAGLSQLIAHDEASRCTKADPERRAIDERILVYTATASEQITKGSNNPSALDIALGRARAAIRLERYDLAEQIGRNLIAAPVRGKAAWSKESGSKSSSAESPSDMKWSFMTLMTDECEKSLR